jgi:3-deoxy-D-manno-octulosonic-acid transferase
LPVLVGPSQFNFQTICEQLTEVGALSTVADANELARQLVRLLQDDEARSIMGERGRAAVAANKGALDRIYDLAVQYLPA